MNVHQAVEHVEASEAYEDFKKEGGDHELVHAFCTEEKTGFTPWQIGYYSKKSGKIISFAATEEVTRSEEDDPFRKEGHVPILDQLKVTTTLDEALGVAEQVRAEKHKAESITKKIIILQTLEDNPTWNITLITHAFNMINVRVDATSGQLIATETHSILNLGQRT